MSLNTQQSAFPRCYLSRAPQMSSSQFLSLESIFAKPQTCRTQIEIDFVVQRLKKLHFFSSMQKDDRDLEDLLVELISVMDCEAFKKEDTVFSYGDKASKFYIILKGSVDVYVPKADEEFKKGQKHIEQKKKELKKKKLISEKEINFLTKKPEEKSTSLRLSRSGDLLAGFKLQNDLINLDEFQNNQEEMIPKLKKIRSMNSGAYFGEIALSLNCSRSATIIASSDLLVATISRDDYKMKLRHFERNLSDKVDFFKKLINVQDLDRIIAKFCYSFKERRYFYEQKVFTQGEMPNEVFIVKQGEVQIFTHEYQAKISSSIKSPIFNTQRAFTQKLANLGPYNLLGENEALVVKPYNVSAISVSNDTILYTISAKEFQDLKANYNMLFEKILATYESKATYFESRLENIQAITKKVSEEPLNKTKRETRAPKSLTRREISHVHSPTFIEKKLKQVCSQRVEEGQIKQINHKNIDYSPLSLHTKEDSNASLFSDFKLDLPISRKNTHRLLPKFRTESMSTSTEATPKQVNTEKSTFRDYWNADTQAENEGMKDNKSRPPKFIIQLKRRSLKVKKTEPVALLIKSQKLFASTHNLGFKDKTKISTQLDKEKQTNISFDDYSCDDHNKFEQKTKKPRCSIVNHLK